ncbi:fungal-specific transcription factor domain-containing protein [Rhizoctonia solani]|nr:fungal-specific transcription factor domain-containing protein [Rhizoctonia solani]
MSLRSTTGCYTCKRRRKKCDETHPHCERCIRAGRECEGYAPLENPDSRGVMRRAKVGPAGAVLSGLRENPPVMIEQRACSPASANILDQQRSSDTSSTLQSSSSDNPVSFLPREVIWHPDVTIPTSFSLAKRLSGGRSVLPEEAGNPEMSYATVLSYPANSDDCSTKDHLQDVMLFQAPKWSNLPRHLPDWAHGSISEDEKEEDPEDDPSVKQEMCVIPVLDPNTPENTLPFILQCYARWIKLVLFEPSRGAHPLKENIVNRFMHSPQERPRIILLANAIGSLGKCIRPSPKATLLVAYLSTEAYKNLNKFISDKPASDREVDRRNALDALDLVMEVILIQRYFHSLFTLTKFMEAVAPVFRRACPEPMDQYVNLPRAILSTDINIRNFATGDVILSATTGRPMLFKYDMTYPPDALERLNDGGSGMQWLHGMPDQYVLVLARINMLVEELEFGDAVSPHCVAEIEKQIREVKPSTELSADPISMVWQYMVRECWRLAMYLYLYMVLCQTSTDDPRVLKSVKSYIRLLQSVKAGRKPDAFLYLPMIIVGASAYDKRDRMVVRERMLGLPECTNPGCSGYDVMRIFTDLWTRTDAENRAALWSDFRISTFRISGV